MTLQDQKLLFVGNWVAAEITNFDADYWLQKLITEDHINIDLGNEPSAAFDLNVVNGYRYLKKRTQYFVRYYMS